MGIRQKVVVVECVFPCKEKIISGDAVTLPDRCHRHGSYTINKLAAPPATLLRQIRPDTPAVYRINAIIQVYLDIVLCTPSMLCVTHLHRSFHGCWSPRLNLRSCIMFPLWLTSCALILSNSLPYSLIQC